MRPHVLRKLKRHEQPKWRVQVELRKYHGDWTPEEIDAGLADDSLYDIVESRGNMLTIGGVSAIWERLIGTSVTAFGNANANLAVGNSATAAADTQTDLQAAAGGANRQSNAMDATYPLHTDTTGTAGSKTITYRSTFATGEANFTWNEWGIFNGAAGTGRMLNRKVENLGTKTSSATWQLTVTVSLA